MKSHCSRIAALACAASMLVAGTASAAMWHYGARAGLSLTNFRGDAAELLSEWRPGPAAGGFVEADATPSMSFVFEVDYVQKGATYSSEVRDNQGTFLGTQKNDLVLSYVQVPMLARVHFMNGGAIGPFVEAGPTLGFTLGGTQEMSDVPDIDIGDHLNALDVGIGGGVGVRFRTGAGRLDVETRYTTGLGDVWNDTVQKLETINHGFEFTLSLSR